ncbi:MAG: hypothetical protein M0Z46_05455 [Actinomycetota bacterium]|jgi:hypothetical protein|nr:hypothetical protein [Actinomycetota bacterium]
MTVTKVAAVGCLALLGFVCWLAAAGVGPAREGLISVFALVVLVGGGNLLSGRAGTYGGRRTPALRDPGAPEPDGLDAARHDEPAP